MRLGSDWEQERRLVVGEQERRLVVVVRRRERQLGVVVVRRRERQLGVVAVSREGVVVAPFLLAVVVVVWGDAWIESYGTPA
ncbi:MAG: hypothetical protein Fur0025_24540 [Oscillatoriaceae cyanobacterium]